MLPAIRCNDHLYSVPKFDLGKGDVKDFMNELSGFHEQFADCFQRSESREHFFKYMVGQFSPLERKSIEPIALAVKDGNVRAMQRFVSDAPWDDENMIAKYRNLINDDLGSPDGALIFDESGFIKKGQDSISEKSTTAKLVYSPPTSQSKDTLSSTSNCLFPKSGSPTRILNAGESANYPQKLFSAPNPSWLWTCSVPLLNKERCPSSMC